MSIINRRINIWKNILVLGVFSLALSFFSVLLVGAYNAHAAPGKINYQGRLTDATGVAKPDGQYNMKFRIHSAASGGSLLWSEVRETTNRVTVTGGQFSVQLGAVTPVPSTVFAGDSTYFEVELPTPATATCSTASCGTYTEGAMTPRQPVSSSAYALNSDTLDGYDSSAFGRIGSFNIWSDQQVFATGAEFNYQTQVAYDSANAFRVMTAAYENIFSVDTANKIVSIGTGSGGTNYFGSNAIGASVDTSDSNAMNFSRYQTGATTGTTSQVSVYMASTIDSSPNNKYTIAIYSGTATAPVTRIAVSTEGSLMSGWNTVPIVATLSPSTYYWIGYTTNGTAGNMNNMSYDNTGTSFFKGDAYTNGFPVTMTGGTTGGTQAFSIYVDFVGASPALTTTASGKVGVNTISPSATLDVAGTALFKNRTDSAVAFQIQNAAAGSLFSADTGNSRIQIGSSAADATAIVLVLDTKNTAGDPTGANGAMYYNSNAGKFRCYENAAWKDCISTTATDGKASLIEQDDFLQSAFVSDVFAVGATGTGASRTQVAGAANHPGIISMTSGTTATGASSIASDLQGVLLGNVNVWTFNASVRVPTLSTAAETFRVRAGFTDSITTDPVDGCFMRYGHDLNAGKWTGVCRSNSTESTCDTTVTAVANTWYNLQVGVNSAGTTTTFVVNGSSSCTVSANIPIAAGRQAGVGAMINKTVGTTARTFEVDYVAFSAAGMSR